MGLHGPAMPKTPNAHHAQLISKSLLFSNYPEVCDFILNRPKIYIVVWKLEHSAGGWVPPLINDISYPVGPNLGITWIVTINPLSRIRNNIFNMVTITYAMGNERVIFSCMESEENLCNLWIKS